MAFFLSSFFGDWYFVVVGVFFSPVLVSLENSGISQAAYWFSKVHYVIFFNTAFDKCVHLLNCMTMVSFDL